MKATAFRSGFFVLVAIALVLSSCGPRAAPAPASTPRPAPAAPATPTPSPLPAAPVTPTPTPVASTEKPKYGGTINILTSVNLEVFGAAAVPRSVQQSGYVLEQITNLDWAVGPAGSRAVDYGEGIPSFEQVKGWLAEKWQTPQLGVWVLDIRRGVHFALDPNSAASKLVNGREMTTDDVAFSIEYLRDTPSSWLAVAQPALAKGYSVEKTGPWQLTVKTPVDPTTGYCWMMGGGGSQFVWAREMLEKYGKSNEWRDQVGTGPYILTDFVSGSVATYTRNRNYWQKNPVGPGKGDQLPYPDGAKLLIVPDLSTQLAAMRTGRADWIAGVLREDAASLMRTAPKLKSYQYLIGPMHIAMRTDKQELPYKDKKVRQALAMATDREALTKDFYGGQAEIVDSPARNKYPTIYTALDKLPESARALYKYSPEKAKQLLAEAGYPNGFKAKMIVQSTSSDMDLASAVKAMWAKAGVEVELQPREGAVFRAISSTRSHEDMLLVATGGAGALSTRYGWLWQRGPTPFNVSYINDSVVEENFREQQKCVMVDYAKCDQIIKEVLPYFLEQSYTIQLPAPYGYRLWQPWLKNYHGESADKFWLPYAWIDQDLKEQMTGRR